MAILEPWGTDACFKARDGLSSTKAEASHTKHYVPDKNAVREPMGRPNSNPANVSTRHLAVHILVDHLAGKPLFGEPSA